MEIKLSMKKYFFVFATALAVLVSACNTETEDPNADLTRDMNAIDAYLQASGISEDRILYDNNSGIRFVFNSYGQGIAATPGQTVTYDVIGSVLSNGTIGPAFINSIEEKKLEEVTPEGLQFALRSVLKGSDVSVYVPARFGYGTSGNSTLGIPGDAILRYDLLVSDVTRTITQQNQFQQDTAAIKDFIVANNIIDAIQHESGFWYKVEEAGTGGGSPNPYDAVTFDYELRTITNPDGTAIETNTLTDQFVWGLVQGLRIGFQLMDEGATYTFYFPSGMCYGPSSLANIPANSNLIFKIKLRTIKE